MLSLFLLILSHQDSCAKLQLGWHGFAKQSSAGNGARD